MNDLERKYGTFECYVFHLQIYVNLNDLIIALLRYAFISYLLGVCNVQILSISSSCRSPQQRRATVAIRWARETSSTTGGGPTTTAINMTREMNACIQYRYRRRLYLKTQRRDPAQRCYTRAYLHNTKFLFHDAREHANPATISRREIACVERGVNADLLILIDRSTPVHPEYRETNGRK